eukprot:TRINITY_DN23440_c0_g1_i1.p1 TRINITY_DN23440_c0_g1~~TRINITY_DN23440_c0_g1_i1.p1  ORF type:complete len:311 (+),score=86.06 TRINITY_DN23440_c0_g1_i1:97-1029(+)
MQFSRPSPKENLNLTFEKWMKIHDHKIEKSKQLYHKSQRHYDLKDVGRHTWNHFTLGDPYGEFRKDKMMALEARRFLGGRQKQLAAAETNAEGATGNATGSRSPAGSASATALLGGAMTGGMDPLDHLQAALVSSASSPAAVKQVLAPVSPGGGSRPLAAAPALGLRSSMQQQLPASSFSAAADGGGGGGGARSSRSGAASGVAAQDAASYGRSALSMSMSEPLLADVPPPGRTAPVAFRTMPPAASGTGGGGAVQHCVVSGWEQAASVRKMALPLSGPGGPGAPPAMDPWKARRTCSHIDRRNTTLILG